VGAALAKRLVAEGHEVWAVRRSKAPGPEGTQTLALDLGEPAALAALPEGLSAVVWTVSPDGRDDAAYARAYVDGPRALQSFLAERGDPVQRFVLTTSTGVYAQTDGSWVDEESPTEPTHHSGVRMIEGERVVQAGPFDGVALRLGGIYGPGRTSFVDRVRHGEARQPRASIYTNRIHRDDCAGALHHLLAHPAPEPVYVGVDREPAALAEVQAWLAEQLGVPEPPLEDEQAVAAVGRRARSNKRCRSDRLVASGYSFIHPTYREGYAAVLGV
jgi:nucleoside-diphosphate-sugar epimerase